MGQPLAESVSKQGTELAKNQENIIMFAYINTTTVCVLCSQNKLARVIAQADARVIAQADDRACTRAAGCTAGCRALREGCAPRRFAQLRHLRRDNFKMQNSIFV